MAGLIDLSGGDGVQAGVSRRIAEALARWQAVIATGTMSPPAAAFASVSLIPRRWDGHIGIPTDDLTLPGTSSGSVSVLGVLSPPVCAQVETTDAGSRPWHLVIGCPPARGLYTSEDALIEVRP